MKNLDSKPRYALFTNMTSNNSLSLKQGVLVCEIQAFDQSCAGPLLAPES